MSLSIGSNPVNFKNQILGFGNESLKKLRRKLDEVSQSESIGVPLDLDVHKELGRPDRPELILTELSNGEPESLGHNEAGASLYGLRYKAVNVNSGLEQTGKLLINRSNVEDEVMNLHSLS